MSLSRFALLLPALNFSPKLRIPLPGRVHIPKPCFTFCNLAEYASQSVTGTSYPLPEGLRPEMMPEHVALILDGNKRWAEQRGLGSDAGHDAGLHTLLKIIGLCSKWGVRVASFFLFSSENWRRPRAEVEFIIRLFQKTMVEELDNFKREGIRISTIGDTSLFPDSFQELLKQMKEETEKNSGTHVIFAISYSGQDDIVKACQRIAMKVKDGFINPNEITKSQIEQELETNITSIPCPDLLIRTSGELRISNFLLWQLAYSELYFADVLWPDFGEPHFRQALLAFHQRRRRFGGRSIP